MSPTPKNKKPSALEVGPQETPRGIPTKYKGTLFASKFEKSLAEIFDKAGTPWQYEITTVPWQPPQSTYTPDFLVTMPDGTQQFVEVKGFLDASSRVKMLCVQEQHPTLDIAFLFQRGSNKLTKAKTSQTYVDWAKAHNFKVVALDSAHKGLVYV